MAAHRRRLAAGVLLAGTIAAGALLSPRAAFGRLRWLVWSPAFPAALVCGYLLRPFLFWPISALSVVVGYRYGIALGLPIALAGAVGTSLIPYGAARYVGVDLAAADRVRAASRRFFARTGDLRGLIAARLAPTPAEATSAAAGLGGVSVPAFALGTALGELPWTVAAVLAGNALTALQPGSGAEAVAPDPWLVAVGGLGAAVLLAGPAYRAVRERGSLTGS